MFPDGAKHTYQRGDSGGSVSPWPEAQQWGLALLILVVQTVALVLVLPWGEHRGGSHIATLLAIGLLFWALVFLGAVLAGLAAAAHALLRLPEERGGCVVVVRACAGVAVVVGATCWIGLLLPRWTFWLYLPIVELLGLLLVVWMQARRHNRVNRGGELNQESEGAANHDAGVATPRVGVSPQDRERALLRRARSRERRA